MKTVILCGGKGTRAHPHTVEVPKPLLHVGERPVVAHLMDIFASQGFDEFVLAAGYKSELIDEFASTVSTDWSVEVLDTGVESNTGERVRRCADVVGEQFFVTYADGLGNVDLAGLADFHRGHDGWATVTTVPLPSPYGTIETDPAQRVVQFREKPRLADHFINAGFFVMDRIVFDHWAGDDLENEVLPALGGMGRLFAFRHHGFWKSMDTYKDALELTRLCEVGSPPWAEPPPR
ncbi:MAG TPA: sugar phosphate nucleotidyltransferase [Acidimicrobiales bacterium]|jgi:glucose-1-phosphate cytidylyltransferase